jgi:hypothetical protein
MSGMNFSTIIIRYDPLGETSITRKLLMALLLGTKVEIIGMGIVVQSFPSTKGSITKLVMAGVVVAVLVGIKVGMETKGSTSKVFLAKDWVAAVAEARSTSTSPYPSPSISISILPATAA